MPSKSRSRRPAHENLLTCLELRHFLDPTCFSGPDFPGETFRVLKENQIRKYGEYRTRRLVSEARDRMCQAEQA